jgi:nucleotide-binding universal stress UspA family protein
VAVFERTCREWTMIERILFATDFSRISDRAESYVTQIAAGTGARVLVLHAIEPIGGHDEDDEPELETVAYMAKLEARATEKAAEVVERLRAAGVDGEFAVRVDKRWKAVTDVADAEPIDLIVVGSHRVREGEKIYLGTTSHKVFFATDKPLLVVPQG